MIPWLTFYHSSGGGQIYILKKSRVRAPLIFSHIISSFKIILDKKQSILGKLDRLASLD